MKGLFLSLGLCFMACTASAQFKAIKRIFSNQADTARRPVFLPVPVFGYSQDMGFNFGVGAIYAFYTNPKDTLNRTSSLRTALSFSTQKEFNAALDADVWNPTNEWHYTGVFRFKKSPYDYYGNGNSTHQTAKDEFELKTFRLNAEVERKFSKDYFVGLLAGYEHYTNTDEEAGGPMAAAAAFPQATGTVLWLGASTSFDSRNRNSYPTKGSYARTSWQLAPHWFNNSDFYGSLLKVDLRTFHRITPKAILAAQAVYEGLYGTNTGFYLLRKLGNDALMRGYYEGRYRDNNLLAAQAELRYRYNNRFGAVAFAGAGNVFGPNSPGGFNIKPNLGAGLRYFYDAEKGLALRLDYGIGIKNKGEKMQNGFYLALSEAF